MTDLYQVSSLSPFKTVLLNKDESHFASTVDENPAIIIAIIHTKMDPDTSRILRQHYSEGDSDSLSLTAKTQDTYLTAKLTATNNDASYRPIFGGVSISRAEQ